MIKKIMMFCLLFFMPCIVNAYTVEDKIDIDESGIVIDIDKPVNWSLAALSSVLRDLYNHHCEVDEPELFELSDYIYKENPTATVREIANKCKFAEPHLTYELYRYSKKDGKCPKAGKTKPGYEYVACNKDNVLPAIYKNLPEVCEYFIQLLIKEQNKYVDSYAGVIDAEPGFYVRKVDEKYGGVYEIVDFIHSGHAEKDTIIREIDADGNPTSQEWFFSTDIIEDDDGNPVPAFVNISTSGHTRGIHEKSYIYPNVDLTRAVINLCRQYDNSATEVFGDLYDFHPGNTFDVKDTFCNDSNDRDKMFWRTDLKNLRMSGQTIGECNVNGVMFDGKLVTLQWLGHWLYGCKRMLADGGKGINTKRYNNWAWVAQMVTNIGKEGQASDDGVFKNVQTVGSKVAEDMLFFQDTQVQNKKRAIELVKEHLVYKRIAKNKDEVSECVSTYCKAFLGQQDYVTCKVGNKYYKFEFDDICNDKDVAVPQYGAGAKF